MNSTKNYDFSSTSKSEFRKVLILKLSDLIKTKNKINYNFSSPIIVCDEHDLLLTLKIANSSIFNIWKTWVHVFG